MEMGGVTLRGQTVGSPRAEPPLVLRHGRSRCASRFCPKPDVWEISTPAKVCVLSPAGPHRPSRRSVPKLPVVVASGEATLREPELVVGAAGHRVVALARIERPSSTRSDSTSSGMMKCVSA